MKSILLLLCCIPLLLAAQDNQKNEVKKAAFEYIDGMYDADPQKITEVVHPELAKFGFYWKTKNQEFSELKSVSYKQFYQIAKDWNRDKWLPANAPREVDILDFQDKIASVKVTAYWGIDYLHLVKMKDKWSIVSVLWQNYPKIIEKKEEGSENENDSNN